MQIKGGCLCGVVRYTAEADPTSATLCYCRDCQKFAGSVFAALFIPGGGSVETYDFCIENDYNYSYLSFFGYLRAQKLMANYWQRVSEMGADDSPYRATFAQCICVAETDAEAERLYGPHVSYFFNRCLHVYPGFADAPGYRTIKTIQPDF